MFSLKKTYLRIRVYLVKIAKQNACPHILALSFAIGSFIAIIPLFGFGILIGLTIAITFKKLNKIALMSAFLIWNPIIVVPIMTLSYQIGDEIFGDAEIVKYKLNILNHIFTFTRRFLVGHSILNIIATFSSYFMIRLLIYYYDKRKKGKKGRENC